MTEVPARTSAREPDLKPGGARTSLVLRKMRRALRRIPDRSVGDVDIEDGLILGAQGIRTLTVVLTAPRSPWIDAGQSTAPQNGERLENQLGVFATAT
jgi:hypothetical protein